MVTSLTRLQLCLLGSERIDVAPLARLTRLTYLAVDFNERDEDVCSITRSTIGSRPGCLPPRQLRELCACDGAPVMVRL